jgi:hypothetical protein
VTIVTIEEVEKAAELLETVADGFQSGQYEWVQGEYETVRGPKGYCSVGALRSHADRPWSHVVGESLGIALDAMRDVVENKVLDNELRTVDSVNAAWITRGHIGKHLNSEGFVISFNDKIAKGPSEVIEVMKQAAKNLRNQS